MPLRIPEQPDHPVESVDQIPDRLIAAGVLRLDREGRWLIGDGPITHPKLKAFLWRHLMRNREGQYWIVNGPQRVLVEFEDTPLIVRHVFAENGALMFELGDGSVEPLPDDGLLLRPDGGLVATVACGRYGDTERRGHAARLTRTAVADLATWLDEDGDGTPCLKLGERMWPIRAEM
ncbi:MAG: DUF2946 family protein [Candidatus Dadabacteria bacterium]|nr:MAG: DUF2946 family protein [Candidatus Dadabacteria bacterium]